jgi:hypothetical protein
MGKARILPGGAAAVLGGGPQPEAFWETLEELTATFRTACEIERDSPTMVHIKAALDELSPKLAELCEKLDFPGGLDYQTRGAIAIHGREPSVVNNAFDAIRRLSSAVELTKVELAKTRVRSGPRPGPNVQFAAKVYAFLIDRNLSTNRSALESCVGILLDVAGQGTGADNVHRLAVAARKLVKNSPAATGE